MTQQKISYLLDSASRFFFEKKNCPYCESTNVKKIDSKYFFTQLLQCQNCYFQSRFPYDTVAHNKKFYQKKYKQSGLTTDLPSKEQLKEYLKNDFRGTEKDFSFHANLIKKLVKDITSPTVIDYGANWGYTSHQFTKQGFSVQSFEISKERGTYGNKALGLQIQSEVEKLTPGNDVVFSSHVIEHLPDVKGFISLGKKLLKPSGIFIAFSPNGSSALHERSPSNHHFFWGQAHPNFLSAEFYKFIFKHNPYIITSDPYDENLFSRWDQNEQIIGKLDGVELLLICKPNKII